MTKIMTENGLFVLGRPETHLHDILWAVHDVKNHGRTEGQEIFREFPFTVGGRCRAMQCGLRVSLICVRVCKTFANLTRARRSLTEPE